MEEIEVIVQPLEDGMGVKNLSLEEYKQLFLLEHSGEKFAYSQAKFVKEEDDDMLKYCKNTNNLTFARPTIVLTFEEFYKRAKITLKQEKYLADTDVEYDSVTNLNKNVKYAI